MTASATQYGMKGLDMFCKIVFILVAETVMLYQTNTNFTFEKKITH